MHAHIVRRTTSITGIRSSRVTADVRQPGARERRRAFPWEERPSPVRSTSRYLLLLDEPELPELPDDPEEPDEPDEPDEALRPDCPLLLEPDMPPELDDPAFRSRSCDELDELPLIPLERSDEELLDAFRAPPGELDDPELPPTPPVVELPDDCRSRSDAEYPSPCDELPRSRFELPDDELLSL